MITIVGLRKKTLSFKGDSDHIVSGFQVYCTDDSNSSVDGVSTLDFFMSDNVCARSDYSPVLGDCLDFISYNRFGRLDRVFPCKK